ncbi:MAG TPA: Rap1a/Tai family immunity protein [Candidatus Binatia bacterium]|nr:Rap1a/Tai family immunity protein [Candidatus Binatia bacterium]
MSTRWTARVVAALFLGAVCLHATPGRADFREGLSGADLVKLCEAKGEIPPVCAAYIDGVRSGMRTYRLFLGWSLKEAKIDPPPPLGAALAGEPFCIPAGTPSRDVILAIVRFVKDFEPAAKESASLSVVTALRETYPCTPPPAK